MKLAVHHPIPCKQLKIRKVAGTKTKRQKKATYYQKRKPHAAIWMLIKYNQNLKIQNASLWLGKKKVRFI